MLPHRLLRLLGLMIAAVSLTGSGLASTLAQTQLKGLAGVSVYVDVVPELRSAANDIERTIKKRVEDLLVQTGIATVAKNGEALRIYVDGLPIANAKEPTFALFISVRLREHVSLRRDASLDVPGGGGFTWWREGLWVSSRSELAKTIAEAVLGYVELFTDQVKSANPESAASRRTERK